MWPNMLRAAKRLRRLPRRSDIRCKVLSYWAPALRAVATRLQAEYIPPLRLIPLVGHERSKSRSLPRARGRCRACEAEEVHELTGKNKTQLQVLTSVVARARRRCPGGAEEVLELTGKNKTQLQVFTSVVARARARSAGCRGHPWRRWPAGPEEVHELTGKNKTQLQVLTSVVARAWARSAGCREHPWRRWPAGPHPPLSRSPFPNGEGLGSCLSAKHERSKPRAFPIAFPSGEGGSRRLTDEVGQSAP